MSRRHSRSPPSLIDTVSATNSTIGDDERESSRQDNRDFGRPHPAEVVDPPLWDDQYSDVEPSDSASALEGESVSHDGRPLRTHSRPPPNPAAAPHRSSQGQFSFRHVPAPAPPTMSSEPSDDSYYGRGFSGPPQSHHPAYYAQARGPPAPGYAQSHAGYPHAPYNSVVPYNPFSPMASGGASYFGDPRGPTFGDVSPYGHHNYYPGSGHGYPPVPAHMQQYMYHSQPPPPPPTEHPGQSVTPAPLSETEKALKLQIDAMRAEKALAVAEHDRKKMEDKIRREAEESFTIRMEEMRRAQEDAKKEIEKAKIEAERAAKERIEAERRAEEERRRLHEEAMKRIEREAREKLEAERRADDERKKREAEVAAAAEVALKAKIEAAEAAAKAKVEAAVKAEEEAKATAAKKAAEELEWRKKLEEAAEAAAKAKVEAAAKVEADAKEAAAKKAADEVEWRKKLEEEAKLKAEVAAREKVEKERQEAEDAKKAAEEKKKEDEEYKKKVMEDAKAKAEEAAKKGDKAIKFKDAVGRKFSFPFHLCQTWPGMEELIKQAFVHVEFIGPHVQAGHYDLIGPDGEIILPSVWEKTIKPDWAVTMHMWPMDKGGGHMPRPGPGGHHGHIPLRPGAGGMRPGPGGMRPNFPSMRPPVPPTWPGGHPPGGRGAPADVDIVNGGQPKAKRSSSKKETKPSFFSWGGGGGTSKKGTGKKKKIGRSAVSLKLFDPVFDRRHKC